MKTLFLSLAAIGLLGISALAAGPADATQGNGQGAQRGPNGQGPGAGQCQGQGNGQGAMRGYCGGRGAGGGQGPHGNRCGPRDGTGPRRDGSCLQGN